MKGTMNELALLISDSLIDIRATKQREAPVVD